jgi:hypothetical protein
MVGEACYVLAMKLHLLNNSDCKMCCHTISSKNRCNKESDGMLRYAKSEQRDAEATGSRQELPCLSAMALQEDMYCSLCNLVPSQFDMPQVLELWLRWYYCPAEFCFVRNKTGPVLEECWSGCP